MRAIVCHEYGSPEAVLLMRRLGVSAGAIEGWVRTPLHILSCQEQG
jgi:hypothetical protein